MAAFFGTISLPMMSTTGTITFVTPLIVAPVITLGISNVVDVSPSQSLGDFGPIVTSFLEPTPGNFTGFTYELDVSPATTNYKLTVIGFDDATAQILTTTIATTGRRFEDLPGKLSLVTLADRLPLLDSSDARKKTSDVRLSQLLNVFAGVITVPPESPNSIAFENSIRVIHVGDKHFLTVGVGPNLVGRIELNTTSWGVPDSFGYRQRFSFQLTSGLGIHDLVFNDAFAGSPTPPPVIAGWSIRNADGITTPESIAGVFTNVTNTGFRFISNPPPTGNYYLEGEAVQETA